MHRAELGSNSDVWVHLEKELLGCNGLGSIGHSKVGCAYAVLTWLGSTVLRVVLLSWAYLESRMIHCVSIGSARLRLPNSGLG